MFQEPSLQRQALDGILAQLQPPKLTDAQVLALAFLLPRDILLSALELVDSHSVRRVTAPYGATLYTVDGSSHPYLLSPSPPAHCSCPAFAFTLVAAAGSGAGEHDEWEGLCKHLLALRIALRLEAVVEERLDEGDRKAGEEATLALLGKLGLVG